MFLGSSTRVIFASYNGSLRKYLFSMNIFLDGQPTNDVAAADGIIHRPVSIVLPKEQPGTDPSFLENTLEELLNKNQEKGNFNWNEKDKEVTVVHLSSQV